MLLFVGLGNPGSEYAGNRHNVGFRAVEAIARVHRFPPFRRKFRGEASEGTIGGVRVVLLKPLTYMNDSGQSVGEAARFLKIATAAVTVFYDELDLEPSRVRVKTGGGAAGHNGIRSLAAHLGPEFRRVRIGIGHPGARERVHGYVLSDFAKSEREWVGAVTEAIAEFAPLLAEGADASFQNKVHLTLEARLG